MFFCNFMFSISVLENAFFSIVWSSQFSENSIFKRLLQKLKDGSHNSLTWGGIKIFSIEELSNAFSPVIWSTIELRARRRMVWRNVATGTSYNWIKKTNILVIIWMKMCYLEKVTNITMNMTQFYLLVELFKTSQFHLTSEELANTRFRIVIAIKKLNYDQIQNSK